MFFCSSNHYLNHYRGRKAGSALSCRIINKSLKNRGRHFQKYLLKFQLLINNIEFYKRLQIFLCFLSTIFIDFIFVDFDKILDKCINFSAFFWELFYTDPAFLIRYMFLVVFIWLWLHFTCATSLKTQHLCFFSIVYVIIFVSYSVIINLTTLVSFTIVIYLFLKCKLRLSPRSIPKR
jgi:hypothetical protein